MLLEQSSNPLSEGISKFDLDSRTNSASEHINAVTFSNRKRNVVGSIQGAGPNGGAVSGLAGPVSNQNDIYQQSLQRERGFPTPNRHKIAGSLIGGSGTDIDNNNCERNVTSAKSNDNTKSGAFGGAHSSHQTGTINGADRPTLSGNGIKSLQSTAKKNRIIINDDLRSQHKM